MVLLAIQCSLHHVYHDLFHNISLTGHHWSLPSPQITRIDILRHHHSLFEMTAMEVFVQVSFWTCLFFCRIISRVVSTSYHKGYLRVITRPQLIRSWRDTVVVIKHFTWPCVSWIRRCWLAGHFQGAVRGREKLKFGVRIWPVSMVLVSSVLEMSSVYIQRESALP